MNLIISQLVATLPWASGIFALYLIMPKYFRSGTGWKCLMIGAGFLIGYLGLAVQMWALYQLGVKSISPSLLATTCGVLLICLAINYLQKKEEIVLDEMSCDSPVNFIFLSIFCLCLIVVFFVAHENFLWPAIAWDTVMFWATEANEFLIQENSKQNESTYAPLQSAHPTTIIYIMAWGGWSASLNDPSRLAPFIPWFHLYLAIAIAIFGLFLRKTQSYLISIIFTFMFLSTPLVEAQASLPGYADLWISFAIFISIFFFGEHEKTNDPRILFMALITASMPYFLKGIGSIYSLAIFAMFACYPAVKKWGVSLVVFLFSTLFLITFTLHLFNFDLKILGTRIAILPEIGLLEVAGRQSSLVTNSLEEVFYYIFIALFYKNTFGIIFYVATVSFIYLTTLLIFQNHFNVFPVLAIFTCLTCIFIAALRYSDYFFSFSHPGSDTSLSRAFMMLFLISFIMIADALNKLMRPSTASINN